MKPASNGSDPKIWATYRDIVETADGRHYQWAKLNRAKFYEESKRVRKAEGKRERERASGEKEVQKKRRDGERERERERESVYFLSIPSFM